MKKSDSELLDMALKMLSDYQEYYVTRENLEISYNHHETHCIRCHCPYDSEYLARYGMCMSCYADNVGSNY